jgi:hypothetical protein
MANTATTNTPCSMLNSAGFQAWITEMTTELTAVGLTQTADTGQINPATVALPGAINTVAGYQIWRFNDTLQATSPIFLKLEYGTGGSITSVPNIILSIGQGSNGSGTLTGTVTTRASCTGGNALNSAVANAPSFWVYNPTYGVLACGWKFGINSSNVVSTVPMAGFIIERSCDTNGNATGDAAIVVTPSISSTGSAIVGACAQIFSYLTSALTTPATPTAALNAWSTFWPMNPASSAVGSNNQVMPRFHLTPNIQLSGTSGVCLASEFSMASTFAAALIGTTSKTYIALGNFVGITQNQLAQTGGQPVAGYVLWQ